MKILKEIIGRFKSEIYFTRGTSSSAGFTLVEILVVLVIIGLLGSFLFGKIFSSGETAKARLTELRLKSAQQKINEFRLMYNALPSSLQDLTQCTEVTGPGCVPLLESNDDALLDAWGTAFVYQVEGNARSYRLMSLGADGTQGGEGVNYDFFVTGP